IYFAKHRFLGDITRIPFKEDKNPRLNKGEVYTFQLNNSLYIIYREVNRFIGDYFSFKQSILLAGSINKRKKKF
ncbi:hypothetical protein LZ31DRAFT_485690, partial [Colletotrichum somersetense]